ncbi:MAG: hypothetical protein KBD53_03815 [Candidatus Omnitrophica bacterium]|nr:hypothetical protein [Candidatus Omnitrophota bacterium]
MSREHTKHLNYTVIRWTMVFWLLGWYCKSYFLLPYMTQVIYTVPVVHPLFPPFFLNPHVSVIFFFLPALCIPAVICPTRLRLIFSGLLMTMSSLIMMLHINSYNDATFVTSFWVGLWIIWTGFKSDHVDAVFRQQACLLARLVIGLIFFAGFVGKLTPEYLSGEVFYRIFWSEKTLWPHTWLMAHFTADQLKVVSVYFSNFIVCSELLLACAPLLYSRFIFVIAPIILCCFMITNTWAIFSVVGCLIGMMLSCLFYKNMEIGTAKENA